MRTDRKFFGRLTINDYTKDLGHATYPVLLQRLTEQYLNFQNRGANKVKLAFEISTDKIVDSEISTALREEAKIQSLMTPLDDPSPFDGLSVGQVLDAQSSPEYQAYAFYALNPDKRIGADPDEIEKSRESYNAKYPGCSQHFPIWIAS